MLLCMFEGLYVYMLFWGGDCIIEEVTFEQIHEKSTKEFSGEENIARRKAPERGCAWRPARRPCGWTRGSRGRRDTGKGHLR